MCGRISLDANTRFIYGDLLIPKSIAIYRKSFPERVTRTFVGRFALGAMLAGAFMEWAIGSASGGVAMSSRTLNDRSLTRTPAQGASRAA